MLSCVFALVAATSSASVSQPELDCPLVNGELVLVASAETSSVSLNAVHASSALLRRAPKATERFDLFPLAQVSTATEAFARLGQGSLRCLRGRTRVAEDLRSAADGKPAFDPVVLPSLVVARGSEPAAEGSHEAKIAHAFDITTLTDAGGHVLPVRQLPAQPTSIAGGTALCSALSSPLWPFQRPVCGLLLRAPSDAPAFAPDERPELEPDAIRTVLDEREGSLLPGQTLAFAADGFGAVDLTVQAAAGEAPDPGRSWKKAVLAHSVALGLSGLSVALSFAGKANCTTWCDDAGPIPGDGAYLRSFRRRSVGSIETSAKVLRGLDVATVGLGLLSSLLPSARRGRLSRLEILEDAVIISEGMLVSWTTPLTVQRRLGRAQPRRLHPGFVPRDDNDLVAPTLQAIRVNRAAAVWGAATLLLFLEDASPGWTLLTGATLGALTMGVGVTEVRAGYAFPWDVPISIITGLINGAGTVMWHQLFWPGWPGSERGNAPLRVRGLSFQSSSSHTQVQLSLAF